MTNFQITEGSGTIIATDTGGGNENYQKIKLIDATPSATQGTGIASNPLQVSLENTVANATPIIVDGSGVTQPISVVSLPLPSGAATETTLLGIKTDTDNLDISLSTRASESTVSGIKTQTDELTFVASRLLVDGSGVTQPVNGEVIANIGTTNGLALDATLTGGTQKTQIADDTGHLLNITPSGRAKVDGSDVTQPVSATSLPLPTGASTEVTLALIKAKTDNLDVLLSTRTKPADTQITSISNFPATQPVSIASMPSTPVTGTFFQTVQPVTLSPVAIVSPMTTTFRTLGIATAQNLFTLENPVGSGRTLAVTRLTHQKEQTALTLTLVTVVCARTTALPTGGTVLGSVLLETSGSPVGIARGATASDGGAATAITATLGIRIWTQFNSRLATVAGYLFTPDNPIIPDISNERPLLIAPGNAILVATTSASLTTDHYVINCAWVEY